LALQHFSRTVPLTPRLSGRVAACPARRERTISSSARAAPPQAPHGPLQAVVRGTAAVPQRHQAHLALTHRAHARNSDLKRSQALNEATSADCSRRGSGATQAPAAAMNHCFQSVKYRTEGPAPKLLSQAAAEAKRSSQSSSAPARPSALLPNSPSNGEVEGPPRSASPWRRGRTFSQRPRRQPAGASRTPPTIVRPHLG
jgi:hypothetical protein